MYPQCVKSLKVQHQPVEQRDFLSSAQQAAATRCVDLQAGGYCPLRKARWPLVHLLA